jgi:polar amino acid transport system permease protein
MTLVISLVSGTAAALTGLGVMRLRLGHHRGARAAAVTFVMIFRNVPIVPLLLFLTFAVPNIFLQVFGRPFPLAFDLTLLLLGLTLNTAPCIAEILRAGALAVAPQQIDAARTIGLSNTAIRWLVVDPQAVRIVAPALATRWINRMQNSAMAIVVPPATMATGSCRAGPGQAQRIAGETFSWVQPVTAVAVIYLALSLGSGRLLNRWATRAQARIVARPA